MSNNIVRLTPEKRRAIIVTSAVDLSKTRGICGWTREELAANCTVQTSLELTKHYFPKLFGLRQAILKHPLCTDDMRAQARAVGIPGA